MIGEEEGETPHPPRLTKVISANVKICSTSGGEEEGEKKSCQLLGSIVLTLKLILIVPPVLTRHLSAGSLTTQLKTLIAVTPSICSGGSEAGGRKERW